MQRACYHYTPESALALAPTPLRPLSHAPLAAHPSTYSPTHLFTRPSNHPDRLFLCALALLLTPLARHAYSLAVFCKLSALFQRRGLPSVQHRVFSSQQALR